MATLPTLVLDLIVFLSLVIFSQGWPTRTVYYWNSKPYPLMFIGYRFAREAKNRTALV